GSRTTPASAALAASRTNDTAWTPPSSATWITGNLRYCEYPSVPHGNPPSRWPRSHSAPTQRHGAVARAHAGERRRPSQATRPLTIATNSPHHAASSNVGPHVSGQGISLKVRNVKSSQRSRTRKKTVPWNQPHAKAARGVVTSATTSNGASAYQAPLSQLARGNARASTPALAASSAAGTRRSRTGAPDL